MEKDMFIDIMLNIEIIDTALCSVLADDIPRYLGVEWIILTTAFSDKRYYFKRAKHRINSDSIELIYNDI